MRPLGAAHNVTVETQVPPRDADLLSHGDYCRMVVVKSSKVFVARLVPAIFFTLSFAK